MKSNRSIGLWLLAVSTAAALNEQSASRANACIAEAGLAPADTVVAMRHATETVPSFGSHSRVLDAGPTRPVDGTPRLFVGDTLASGTEPPVRRRAVMAEGAGPATKPSLQIQPVPDTLIHLHDPFLVQAGDSFHVFASHGGLFHWISKDLVHWTNVPSVMKSAPQWSIDRIAPDPGIWAPDVRFFGRKYHLYYSLSRFGSQRSAIGLMTGDALDPADEKYGWKDQGLVVESFPGMDFNAIDPATVFDADNRPWLAWGSFNKGIYLSKLDESSGKLIDKQVHIAARPGNTAIEAPDLFFRDGYYYLIVSYDYCCRGTRSTYNLVVGRSKQITGPYVSRDGKPMLDGKATLLLRTHDFCIGPGHSSVLNMNGRYVLAHHYYDARRNGQPSLAVREMYFDEDGWPVLGEPYAERRGSSFATMAGAYRVQIDYVDAGEIELTSEGLISGGLGEGRFQTIAESGTLSMEWTDTATDRDVTCFVSEDRAAIVGRNRAGQIFRAIRIEP